jgi:hypothetical protein
VKRELTRKALLWMRPAESNGDMMSSVSADNMGDMKPKACHGYYGTRALLYVKQSRFNLEGYKVNIVKF